MTTDCSVNEADIPLQISATTATELSSTAAKPSPKAKAQVKKPAEVKLPAEARKLLKSKRQTTTKQLQ